MKSKIVALLTFVLILNANSFSQLTISDQTTTNFNAKGRTWYVSKNKGSGQLGTKDRPAKDLGNIIHHLKPNDIILISGGTYLSKGSRGSDEINIPVKIYGGYDETFTYRDPWGAFKTIFTGTNAYGGLTQPRLYIRTDQQREANSQKSMGGEIVVDGIIFDNGPRNRYHTDKDLAIRRTANQKSNKNPSPESGGLVIVPSLFTNVIVKNCVIMNSAPTEGALSVRLFKGGKGIVQNNFLINNTGDGIHLRTGYMGRDESLYPQFTVSNNTSLFNWKHDAIASYGGHCLTMDKYLNITIQNNVFGFGHAGGIYNKGTKVKMLNNLFTGNSKYDYRESNSKMKVADILDESMHLDPYSDGNESVLIKINIAKRWANIYGTRKEISRADIEESVHASNSGANQLRSMLGLNTQAGSVATDAEVFLPLIKLVEALPAGLLPWNEKGCQKP